MQCCLTLFLAGGGHKRPPSVFSRAIAKRRKIETWNSGDFSYTFIAHILVKKKNAGSGHQRRFLDPTSKMFAITPQLEILMIQFLLFRFWLVYQYVQFVYLRIFISVTWGQVRLVTFTLQAYGKIFKCVLLRIEESEPPNYFINMTYYHICDDPGAIRWQEHRDRSSEVMWRHI